MRQPWVVGAFGEWLAGCIDWEEATCDTICGVSGGCAGGAITGAIVSAYPAAAGAAGCLGGAMSSIVNTGCGALLGCSPLSACDLIVGIASTVVGCFLGPEGASGSVNGPTLVQTILNATRSVFEYIGSNTGLAISVINMDVSLGMTDCEGLAEVFE